jgi:hypothetical protein
LHAEKLIGLHKLRGYRDNDGARFILNRRRFLAPI